MWFERCQHEWTDWERVVGYNIWRSRYTGAVVDVDEYIEQRRHCKVCMKPKTVQQGYRKLDRAIWPTSVK